MIGALASLLVTIGVVYLLIKRYQTQMVLLAAGLILMVVAVLTGAQPPVLLGKTPSTGFVGFDIFRSLDALISLRVAGTGLIIMIASGFARYMDVIGASAAMVKIAIAPLRSLKAPYIMLVVCFGITIVLKIFIPSAAGLAVLLMATLFPILVALGVSPAAAGAVIITGGCLDFGPTSPNTNVAAQVMEMDVVVYFVNYQIIVAAVGFVTICIAHYIWQKRLDRLDGTAPAFNPELAVAAASTGEVQLEAPRRPMFYALLPTVPLVLLFVFSKFLIQDIRLGVPTAMVMSWVLAILVEIVYRRGDVKAIFKEAMSFFQEMGKQFTAVVSLVIAGEFFGKGLSATGTVDLLIATAQNAGFSASVMAVVMTLFIVLCGIVMGSGQAPFFAFSSLAPKMAGDMGVPTEHILSPMQFGAGFARGMSPITAVVIAVAGLSGVSPFELVRRTIVPMGTAVITTTITSLIVN